MCKFIKKKDNEKTPLYGNYRILVTLPIKCQETKTKQTHHTTPPKQFKVYAEGIFDNPSTHILGCSLYWLGTLQFK